MRKLNFNEMVVLNPLQTRYQLFTSRVLVPLYSATSDGIYRMNRAKRAKSFAVIYGTVIGMVVLVFIMFVGMVIAYFGIVYGFPYLYAMIPVSLIGIIIIIGAVYGIKKLWKIGKKYGKIFNDLEGELVVPWNQVKSIVVMNVRQENVADRRSLTLSFLAPVYKEVGDWHVLTVDGREIVIPNVVEPYNKLEYIKKKFNLNFN